MKEKVELGSIQADIRESNRTKCLNIPRAKVAKCIFQVLKNVFLKVVRKYFECSGKCFSGYVHEHQGQQAVCGEQGGVRPEAEDQRLQKHSMVDIFQLSLVDIFHGRYFPVVQVSYKILRSQCTPGSGQECRMVQRTRCVPVCNKSPECTR